MINLKFKEGEIDIPKDEKTVVETKTVEEMFTIGSLKSRLNYIRSEIQRFQALEIDIVKKIQEAELLQ